MLGIITGMLEAARVDRDQFVIRIMTMGESRIETIS